MRFISFSLVLFIFLFHSSFIHAQGKLMLVGGGSEVAGGWSDEPYQWFVNQASNNKIAIISYGEADNWLPNYFKDLGAQTAVNVKIASREEALNDSIFDYLTGFDGLFFKGGDQSRYFDYYRNTPVQNAIETVYLTGGAIGGTSAGMAILSGKMFTAANGSAFPDDALQNINSEFITISDEFLPFYPNYIFDTHFVERGRTSRLIGFMANWFANTGDKIKGLGVDDRTSLCIDENGIGIVYGTGAVAAYQANHFEITDNQIIDSKVEAVQLTHQQTFDLNNFKKISSEFKEYSDPVMPSTYYNVYASGSLRLSDNQKLISDAVQASDEGINRALLISDNLEGVASNYKAFLENELNLEVTQVETTDEYNEVDSAALRNIIRRSKFLVFVASGNLPEFIDNGPTGKLLHEHVRRNQITSVFLGTITNQLGSTYCTNIYSDPFNAYYGDLAFAEGLKILPESYIITKAFDLDQKDYYENVSSSLVTQLLTNSLAYGVYLSNDAYLKYEVSSENKLLLGTYGSSSSVIVFNPGTSFERTEEIVSGNRRRFQFAFDSLIYKITKSVDFQLAEATPANQEDYTFEEESVLSVQELKGDKRLIKENPVRDLVRLNLTNTNDATLLIYNQQGELVKYEDLNDSEKEIAVNHLPGGLYFLRINFTGKNSFLEGKFLKR